MTVSKMKAATAKITKFSIISTYIVQLKHLYKNNIILLSMKYIYPILLTIFLLLQATSSHSANDKLNIIKEYLKTLDNVAIKFTQSFEGKNSQGIIMIKKPVNFRINYDPPVPILIVGGKNFVSIYDYELNQLSRVKNDDNIFKIIFSDTDNFDDKIIIHNISSDKNLISLYFELKSTNQKAILEFSESPVKLHSIKLPATGIDFEEGIIYVNINMIENFTKFPKEIFNIRDPEQYGKPKRYKSQELLNMLR